MKRTLFYLIPASLRPLARRLYYLPSDTLDCIMKRRPESVPPRGMIFVGHGDYVKQGEKFLEYFKELCGLKPDDQILDIGCGIGRMAVPLTKYLNRNGSYEGFDIVKSGIDWCTKNITPYHPNFRFRHSGMYNKLYNTANLGDASEFMFPYAGNSFDFVILTSVFTHMMPAEVENYIRETARVMKPGAICFSTFFLINCISENLMLTAPTHMNFPVNKGFYRLHSAKVNTANVAYDEEWVFSRLDESGLEITGIHYGQWCGRDTYTDYQDFVIFRKR